MIGRARLFSTTTRLLAVNKRVVPPTTEKLPDVSAFLTRIGRECSELTETYENDWNNLFSWNGRILKEKGVPVAQRKYVLKQVENLRQGHEERVRELKKGKKSFFGGERKRKANRAKWEAEQRKELADS
ncbi:hypothetical protein NCAS_0A01590 [Naumovozyma castellii]|uniref:Small ribosomal subunit protein mS41 n=1 Tax=Naumovozyma castellii TaxID=27288 RepID=G0V5I1_NAUCA|nr:hypothetical protein NCAS_0A01590 [Naumovozyma castellii CBS 4309]CCC66717.1 hypothetical protein NCAS_0A01590 [Naumovozyma castellii CBS 4309]